MRSLFVVLLVGVQLVRCRCECGYAVINSEDQTVFTDLLETNFAETTNISESFHWKPQQFNVSAENGRGKYGKSFVPHNVINSSDKTGEDPNPNVVLGLQVESVIENGAIPGAEIDTTRDDLHWGSYRAGMKLTPVEGTCAAFFWYFNDTQEIDIEFLSQEFKPLEGIYPVNLVVQSKRSKEAGSDASKTGTFKRIDLSFDPTSDFHEYRFDHLPGRVVFYADSRRVAIIEGDEMPSMGGQLILQHWSNGNPEWSGGPPMKDAILSISYVKAYFNSSDEQDQLDFWRRCHNARTKAALCEIPDVTAENATTGGAFFGNEESDTWLGADGEKDSGVSRPVIAIVATIMLWVRIYIFVGRMMPM